MQEKFNSIVFKVRSFVSFVGTKTMNHEVKLMHKSHDSGAKIQPQECKRDDEHAGKQIKETIQVNKEILIQVGCKFKYPPKVITFLSQFCGMYE